MFGLGISECRKINAQLRFQLTHKITVCFQFECKVIRLMLSLDFSKTARPLFGLNCNKEQED